MGKTGSKKRKKSESTSRYIIIIAVVFVGLIGYIAYQSTEKQTDSALSNHYNPNNNPDKSGLREKGSVMPASVWSGRIAEAYRIAAKIPHVIDAQYCNCDCSKNPRFKHKSLLTCFTDDHGANCDICMNEVFLANKLHLKGYSIPEIIKEIDINFSKYSRHGGK